MMNTIERIKYIRSNLGTRDKWDIDDFRDFYESDVTFLLSIFGKINWRPIAEAPKDGTYVLLWAVGAIIGSYDKHEMWAEAITGITCYPTHFAAINGPQEDNNG